MTSFSLSLSSMDRMKHSLSNMGVFLFTKKVFLPVKGQEIKMKMDPQQLIYIYTQRRRPREGDRDFVRVRNHFSKIKVLTDLK